MAQPGQYKFTRIANDKGLSNNQINCILEDSQGFLWFGTMTGLNRYDGTTFKTFRHDSRDKTTLPNNYILSIYEGPEQTIWVNTRAGLSIYNPVTESFEPNLRRWMQKYALPDSAITKVVKDLAGNFWFVHNTQGLYQYNPKNKQTQTFTNQANAQSALHSSQLSDLIQDNKGNFWVIYRDGMLEKRSSSNWALLYSSHYVRPATAGTEQNFKLFADDAGDIWIYQEEVPLGVIYLNSKNLKFSRYHRQSQSLPLNNDLVRSIVQEQNGKIWIGTDHGGVNVIDKKKNTIEYLLQNLDEEQSISQNSIYALYRDKANIIWIGTYKAGISYYHPNSNKFPVYRYQAANPASLPYNDVNRFVEDAQGNIYIGTNGAGLLYFNRATNRFTQFTHNPHDKNSLSNNVIVGMHLDKQQNLWLGTYYGGLNKFDGKTFTHYQHQADDPHSLADDRVWEIYEDSKNNLWVGTLGGGLDLLDRQTGKFQHCRANAPGSIHSDYIFSITEDKVGNLWVGTAYGVDKKDHRTGKFTHYVNNNNNPQGLSSNNVVTVKEDSRGLIWIGTNEGLNILDPLKNKIYSFRQENGLPDNAIQGIVEDDQQTMWLSTQNGISNVKVCKATTNAGYTLQFKNYDVSDGLQDKAFNDNAFLKTRSGDLLFGGSNGFNLFHPGKLGVNKQAPAVVLTSFQLFNQPVKPGATVHDRVLLTKAINQLPEITLHHHENMFTIGFAALNFLQPEKNQYAYQLEGFNEQWLTVDNKLHRVTFTNLDPGTYTFRVKATNNDGLWNPKGAALKITILPPFWKTNLALGIYILLIILALWLARQIVLGQERLKYKLAQERLEGQRRHELDMLKIRFFTNISHEFRTPLTLILSPLEKLLKENSSPGEPNKQLQLIYRNARRLLNLVNQLLDFRKMEVQEIALHPTPVDVIPFIRDIVYSFSDISENKNIQLTFQATVAHLQTHLDQDKLEKILFNLLSNAFKFTPEGGKVSIEVTVADFTTDVERKNLVIQVKDTGIGIPAEDQEKVFQRFFQSDLPGSIINQGSGIGLAITKEFVKLHHGQITMQSLPGQGTCFTIMLPVVQEEVILPEISPAASEVRVLSALASANQTTFKNENNRKKPVVLLVEDNEDFRFYLKDNLRVFYRVEEATNGKQGWNQAVSLLPDLIVSDVIMPEMDGMALSRKLKKDSRTAHIPVILLTANATEEQRLLGYETGASDYITKPFNFEILLSRIKNLMGQQAAFRTALEHKLEVKPQDIAITPLDEKLIQKAVAFTEKNIANPDFSVEELSRELGMSRVYLYKKLTAITGKTPLEFIRTVRLKRAAQLLSQSQLTVAEVAYEVGFNNPKYFTKYFKQEFNELPSAFAAGKRVKV
ncbi:helix-turn-helix domain-containing protein [Adhaeribacter swui]|uniref:histidine kinase n=2 Tax=Adhaeribacter swui TaxID=2086471 RepID=A0A7G7GFM1_9BACT|nr:helix-turn-helix domain-containing protein [Adhaeribacter swui]